MPMWWQLFAFVIFAAVVPYVAPAADYPASDVRNCPIIQPVNQNTPLYRITALPGTGFDNLRNMDMGEVFFYSYSTCKTSNDGKYLIPDNVFLFPILESRIDTFSEFFDHWDNYTSSTSSSINLEANFFSAINGKFSSEFSAVKSHQVNDKSKTTRVQIKHRLYTVKIQPDAQLHPTFKSRLVAIATRLLNDDALVADYLSDLVIRDYGTHYINSLEVGGVLSQTDHLSASYVQSQSQDTTKITASAGVDFFSKISFSAGFSYANAATSLSAFQQARKSSQFVTMGPGVPPTEPIFRCNTGKMECRTPWWRPIARATHFTSA